MKKNKMKNPLYVVKDSHVEQADGPLDFLIKKLNLAPVLEFLNTILKLLLDQVNSYPLFQVFKQFVDLVIKKLELFQKVWVI